MNAKLKKFSASRTFGPEIIPAHTLQKFGEEKMRKEFATWISRTRGGLVEGWTVTFETETDDDEAFAIGEMQESLDEIPTAAMKAFR